MAAFYMDDYIGGRYSSTSGVGGAILSLAFGPKVFQDFLDGEVRYNSLKRSNPEKAARLFAKNESEAKARLAYLKKLVALHGKEE